MLREFAIADLHYHSPESNREHLRIRMGRMRDAGKLGRKRHGWANLWVKLWKTTRGDQRVIIVVIDTGMELDHEDLKGNLLDRNGEDWDFFDSDSSPDDFSAHGTHICGTDAALANNDTGISGVAPECKLMPLRIDLKSGMYQNRVDAINYVAGQAKAQTLRPYVVNCSWKTSGNISGISVAINNLINAGGLVIFEAGNDDRDLGSVPLYPAVYSAVVAVAATDSKDRKWSQSNYGSQVDICAPGANIWSTVPTSDYDFRSGTSSASPHAAGVAALIWSANFSLSNIEVRQILESTCDDIAGVNPGFNRKLDKGSYQRGKGRFSGSQRFTLRAPGSNESTLETAAGPEHTDCRN